jgi:hypothetical protein
MSMKIRVAMSAESSQSEDNLLGMSCLLEVDGKPSQTQEADAFETDLCSVFGVCCRILEEELAGQRRTHIAAYPSRESHGAKFHQ